MKISDILFDQRNLLWIGTRNGLNKFDGGRFETFTSRDGLLHDRIHALDVLSDGRLVILSYNGIDIFDGEKFDSYPMVFNSVMVQMFVDADDIIWINDSNNKKCMYLENGVYNECKNLPGTECFLFYDKNANQKYLLSDRQFYLLDSVIGDPVYTLKRGLSFSFNIDGRPYVLEDIDNSGLGISYLNQGATTRFLDIYPNGDYYEHEENQFVFINRTEYSLPGFAREYGIIDSEFIGVTSAAFDMLGQLWLGTENGLVEFHKPIFYSIPNSKVPYVWTVNEDLDGTIWLGSYGGGLYSYKFGDLRKEEKVNELNFFASSCRDSLGRLIFSSASGLIIKENNNFYRKLSQPVFSIHFDHQRNTYVIGTLGGILLSSDLDSFQYIDHSDGLLNNNYIQALTQDQQGHYWLGCYEGLARYVPGSGEIYNYTRAQGKLPSNGVFCGLKDNLGQLWLGGDKGLMRYIYQSDSIELIESVVLNDIVKSLIQYDDDRLLVGTKSGLLLFNHRVYMAEGTIDIIPINASIGYSGIEPGFTGFFRDSRNKIWITSATSLDIMDPSKLETDKFKMGCQVSRINNKRIPFDHGNEYIYNNELNRSDLNVMLDIIAYSRPGEAMLQYQLDDDPWSEWISGNSVQLNDLTHGIHNLKLRAGPSDADPDLSLSDEIQFSINLAFYKRAFFIPLLSIVISLLSFSLLYYIVRQRLARKKLESQLLESKYLRNQLLLSELNPHFIFNVLASIQNKVLSGQRQAASNYIVKLSKLIRNYLTAAYKGNTPNPHGTDFEITLDKEIEILGSFIEFEKMKSDNHFNYEIILDSNIDKGNIYIPPMLLQPFVENAIKHGLLLSDEKGHLQVIFEYIEEYLVCRILDNGVGVKKSLEINKSKFKTHRSLGSKISQERISILNSLGYHIEYKLKERKTGGTECIIKIKDVE